MGGAGLTSVRNFVLPFFRLIWVSRIVFFPASIREYIKLGLFAKLTRAKGPEDPLYFLNHTYYLSKKLAMKQRVACAIHHHRYEAQNYNQNYVAAVYQGHGSMLWASEKDGRCFSIVLVSDDENRNEGDLKVLLSVDDNAIWMMAFSYVSGRLFQRTEETKIFVTRNQSGSREARSTFAAHFGQSQPQLFCLFAICGLAIANGSGSILAIRHDQQISYKPELQAGFYNSYTKLWLQFAGNEIGHHAYEISLPLAMAPIDQVSSSHRARARLRRKYWEEICLSAESALRLHRKLKGQSVGDLETVF